VDPTPALTDEALEAWGDEIRRLAGDGGGGSMQPAWAALWVVTAIAGMAVVLRATHSSGR
jgi:hypothetical protein